MSENLIQRVFTSLLLFSILLLCLHLNRYLWLFLIILASIISFFEFSNLIKKIWKKNKSPIYLLNIICLFYLYFFILVVYQDGRINQFNILYILSMCILSDIGGYVIGKSFGGKKLTKISPNKTINGSIGSFILPLTLVPLFFYILSEEFNSIFVLVILAIIVSFICQLGDLFISFLKRKANVKDTGDLLPGHGGILDRIDGIIFALPLGIMIWEFLIFII